MEHDPAPQAERDALPPLNALRNFEAVARLGSFAAAAGELHVTHWAVGKQIRLLEDWFGVALFERGARGVRPTEAGAALLADVAGALERLAGSAARLRLRDPGRRIAGVVRVNALASFALHWLMPRLADFQARYPGIEVKLSTNSRKLRYIGDAFDVGVRSGPEAAAGVISRSLMPDLRLPACSPALLRRLPLDAVADLHRHTLLHAASTRGAWTGWLRAAGAPDLRGAGQLEFEHTYLQLAAALEGLGVTLASLPLIGRELAEGRLLCPIAAPAWRAPDYTLVVNADRAGDAAVQAFEQWIVAAAGPPTAGSTPE